MPFDREVVPGAKELGLDGDISLRGLSYLALRLERALVKLGRAPSPIPGAFK